MPADGAVRAAVVLCPPMQFEYYTSHSAYRVLAESLAAAGLAALRLDYTGTGDSAGEPAEVADVSVWLDDIRAAVALLRAAGAPKVGVIGMRMGATLATAAAPDIDFEVAWDPCLTGRRYLREVTLLARAVVEDSPEMLRDLERDQLRIVGYDFPASFAESVSALSMPAAGPASTPTLLLTRHGALPKGFGSWNGPHVTIGEALGQEHLLIPQLDLAVAPMTTIADITDWCTALAGDTLAALSAPVEPVVSLSGPDGGLVTERVVRVGRSGMFAISTDAAGPERLTLVFFNSGAQHRIGPNRLYVEAGRALAAEGVRTIRPDFSSIGDGHPVDAVRTSPYWPLALDDVDDLMADLSALDGPVAVAGLCSGAYHALEAATRFPLQGVFAMHPVLDLGLRNNWPELVDDRRRIWIRDRRWVRLINKLDRGQKIRFRIPRLCWRICAWLRLQPELSSGIRALAARGDTDVVVLMEKSVLTKRRRIFRLTSARIDRLRILEGDGDHGMVSPPARRAAKDALIVEARRWRAAASVAGATGGLCSSFGS